MADEPEPPPPPEGDEEWWPGWPDINQMYRHPAFTVQRPHGGYIEGGDYTRGSTDADTPQTAIRYPISTNVPLPAAAVGQGILYTRPYDYHTVEIFWAIPGQVADKWAEMAIVRSAFGYPDTVNDGQTIYRGYRTTMFPPDGDVPDDFTAPALYDLRNPQMGGKGQLTSGRYYYYSLFFRVNLEWKRSFSSATLLPRNFGHSDHLWNSLPPYYQWTDNQQREGDGDLRRFLRVFGFELDQTREYVEQWQELYHVDFCPAPLLRRLGPNFDVRFESGIGEIRYRSLLAEIGLLYGIRGTRPCLEKVCEAVSKYECDVTQTGNLMTLPDDSDFFEGTGNWAGANPALTPGTVIGVGAGPVLTPDKVFFKISSQGAGLAHPAVQPPSGYGRGVMEVWTAEADELTDVFITCGAGIAYDVYTGKDPDNPDVDLPYGPRYIYPIQVGILSDVAGVYSFTCQIRMPVPYPIDIMLLWFDTHGAATTTSFIERTDSTATLAPPADTWTPFQVVGAVPDGAVYAVPAISFDARAAGPTAAISPIIYIAGAAVYNFGSAQRVSSEAPNPYLLMGDEMRRMGGPIATPPAPDSGQPPLPAPYPGYPLGEKK